MEHSGDSQWWSRRWVQVAALVAVLALAGGAFALVGSGVFDRTTAGNGSTPSPTASPTPSGSATVTPSPTSTAAAVDYTKRPTQAWQLSPADLGAGYAAISGPDPFGTPYDAEVVVVAALSEGTGRLVGLEVRTGSVVWQGTKQADWRGCTALAGGADAACSHEVADGRWEIAVVETATGDQLGTIDVDHWPVAVAGLEGDVVVAGYRCDPNACWVVMSRHPVTGGAPVWATEASSRSVGYPSYVSSQSFDATDGLVGYALNGGLLVVDATTGAIRADLAYEHAGRLWPGGVAVTVDGQVRPQRTTVTDMSGREVLTADGRAWSLWDASSAASDVVGSGKTAYALDGGEPLWQLQGDLSGPGILGTGAEPTEDVAAIDDVAIHLVAREGRGVAADATGYDLRTGAELWTGTLDDFPRWSRMGAYVLATDGCTDRASGFDATTGEVFWRLEPAPGEEIEQCVDAYRETFLLAGDVLLDSQGILRAHTFPTP